jgi:hypothetical protein
MKRRPMAAIALVALLVLAGCSTGYQSPAPEPSEPPGADHLGYYDGYWHNDTFDIDAGDTLTEGQEEAVVSRAMARVQLLRGQTFDERVDVDIISRREYREEFGNVTTPTPTAAAGALANSQFEALLLVGSDRDVVDVRRGNRGDNVLGFYQPSTERLIIVSESDPATLEGELTLAHELVHAVQDQQFNLSSLPSGTMDTVNARNGLVEGDATVVENAYRRNCESGEWECVSTEGTTTAGAPGTGFHFGVYYTGFFPYAEGPTFVQYHHDRGGWDAIDAMYDDLPETSAEVVYPRTYGTNAYGTATVADRSDDDWQRVSPTTGPEYATAGQAGLTSMFAYTLADDYDREQSLIDSEVFYNRSGPNGQLDSTRPFTYDISYAEGWYADRLHAYTSGGEAAYVWNVMFNDRANTTEFHGGHADLLEYWGAETIEDREGATVWRFTDADSPFDGVLWVERDGRTVTVVHAPTVDDLGGVYGPAGD